MPLWYDKRYGTYHYRWREDGVQRMVSLGKNKKIAGIKACELEHRRELGELAPILIRAKIGDHLKWFMEHHAPKRRPATARSYRYALGKLLPFFDNSKIVYLDQITRDLWERFETTLNLQGNEPTRRYSVETRNDIYTGLSVFVNLALERKLILQNPLKGVKRRLKNPRRKPPHIYSEEEIVAIRLKAPPRFLGIIDLILLTGLRRAEAWALEWTDIDFERKSLLVKSNADLDHIVKDYEMRKIDLSDQAIRLLRRLQHGGRYVFDDGAGRPYIGPDRMTHVFGEIKERVGMVSGSLHSLRRTYATRLKRGGADTRYIQAQLGHESLETTEQYLNPEGGTPERPMHNLHYEALDKSTVREVCEGELRPAKISP